MSSHPLDGSLRDWSEVAEAQEWQVLLVGNGLSINVWPTFAYKSFEYAAEGGGLTDVDLALFETTTNFEAVLADLGTAIRVADVLGVNAAPFYERYRHVQLALGHAIRQVHPTRSSVPDSTLTAIREELTNYEWIFTTSYDLLLYWAMGCGPGGRFEPFVDHFRWGGTLQFDPARANVFVDQIPIYFLHGALHLVVAGTGATWKLRRSALQTLLDQFGQPIADDPQARPLLITEGSSRDKLQSIERNDYLSHPLSRLRESDLPIVVFGSSLSSQDQHLLDALNETRGALSGWGFSPPPNARLPPARLTSSVGSRHRLCSSSTRRPIRSDRNNSVPFKQLPWHEIRGRTYRCFWSGDKKETMAAVRYVRESGNGWEVLREGDRRATVHTDTRKKAVDRARDVVRKQGGGEVRVLNRAGKIIRSSKVSKRADK
jgi:hypothetical protein